MAEKIIIYHGSNVEVTTPRILVNGYYKDFCTQAALKCIDFEGSETI
jgi:hypothetical protein